jgi:MiaB-like tRNA modifying enzyme
MKIYIETYGCAANQADSATMIHLLKDFEFVEDFNDADVIIINTCGVKGSTENKILARLEDFGERNVIVAGCLPKIIEKTLRTKFPKYSLIGPDQVLEIENVVKCVAEGERVIELHSKHTKLVAVDNVGEVQPILISQGCLGNCAYCAAKLARGNLHSFPVKDVKAAVKNAVEKGAKKILLTSQDTGAYGKDIGTDLPALLKELVSLNGEFKIRVGMMNPNLVNEFIDELLESFKNQKIIKFLHIPVQSGNDEILKKMNRHYLVEDFKHIVRRFREEIPEITISTDIICGFPGESEEQFKDTLKLVEEIKPEVLNISKFYPRAGTEAKKMEQLPTKVIKERSRKLFDLFKRIKKL